MIDMLKRRRETGMPSVESEVRQKFERNAKNRGQDSGKINKLGLRPMIILGTIKSTPRKMCASEIVRSVVAAGIVDVLDAANTFRAIRTLEKKGLIVLEKSGYTLTESGEKVCPDGNQLMDLIAACKALADIKKRWLE